MTAGSDTTLEPPERRRDGQRATLALSIMFHPDLARVGEVAMARANTLAVSREAPGFAQPGGGEASALGDRHVSRAPITITADSGGVRIDAPAAGSDVVVNAAPLTGTRTFSARELDDGLVLELAGRVVLLVHRRHEPAPPGAGTLGLIGANDAIDDLRRNILRVADLPVPVLIRGETGTGKELVAAAVHAASRRAGRAFIAVNMAAIPAPTAASVLFGHARGAFTGAVNDHVGYFGEADGGSLFLDEIGATPQEIQPMLLRALESHEIQPLGSPTTRTVDTRLIAATDADLEKAISDDSFRAALLHRLEGYQLFVPALRARRDDIGRLLVHFLRAELDAVGELHKLDPAGDGVATWLPASLVARLVRLAWPGNVRQLKNAVRQLVISSRHSDLVVIDAAAARLLEAADERPARARDDAPAVAARGDGRRAADLTEDELVDAMRASDWIANRAAAQLGVSRSYLYQRVKNSPRIPKAADLDAAAIEHSLAECDADVASAARRLEVSKRALMLRMKELGLT